MPACCCCVIVLISDCKDKKKKQKKQRKNKVFYGGIHNLTQTLPFTSLLKHILNIIYTIMANEKQTSSITTGQKVLESILRFEGMTPVELAKALGMPERAQAFYEIRSARTMAISKRLANRILSVKPYYNEEWLMTGEGDMFNEEVPHTKGKAMTEVNVADVLSSLVEDNKKMAKSREEANKEIADAAKQIAIAASRLSDALTEISALRVLIERLTDVVASSAMDNTPKNAV